MIDQGVVHDLEREDVHREHHIGEIVVYEIVIREVDRDQDEDLCPVVDIHERITDRPTTVPAIDALIHHHRRLHHRHRFENDPENLALLHQQHQHRMHQNRVVEAH